MERGGLERRIRLADRIGEERARPRGDAARDGVDDAYDDDRRRREEEELMRQLGII